MVVSLFLYFISSISYIILCKALSLPQIHNTMQALLRIIFLLCGMLIHFSSFSSDNFPAPQDSVGYGLIYKGDTLFFQYITEIDIIAPFKFKNNRQEKRYNKLEIDVRKVYPWATFVSHEVVRIDRELEKIPEKDHKAYMKKFQHHIYDTYMDTLRTFSLKQGKLFLKLIDRESGRTPYELIRDYRSRWQAVLWRGLALLAGGNLDDDYDEDDEEMIEHIIRRIKAGE